VFERAPSSSTTIAHAAEQRTRLPEGDQQMMKRREFLTLGSRLVAATSLLPPYLPAAAADTLDIRAVGFGTGLSKRKFEALLNQTFFIHTETEGMAIVRLVQVIGRDQRANPEQFSLFFRGRSLPSLPAGSYEVEHYLAGRLSLYLEPLPAGGQNPGYRADFSLLR